MKILTGIFLSISMIATGFIFYAVLNHHLFFTFPSFEKQEKPFITPLSKKITIIFPSAHHLSHEVQEITPQVNEEKTIQIIINNWLATLYEEHYIPKKTSAQSVLYNPSHNELFISFDHTIFFKESSIQSKYGVIDSLCKTLKENEVRASTVRLLTHHQPLKDPHFDFTLGWPLEGFENPVTTFSCSLPSQATLIIDPAGNSFTQGRIIDDQFERTLTLLCAQALKKTLEALRPSIKVIITRSLPYTGDSLYLAHFANRIQADLFISIHFYKTNKLTPQGHLYYFTNNSLSSLGSSKNTLQLTPYYYAHEKILPRSFSWVKHLHHIFAQHAAHAFYTVFSPLALPVKPLVGISIPSLVFEGGLTTAEDWKLFVEPIAQALTTP